MEHMNYMVKEINAMRVYISGKITGTSDYMKRFEEAEDYINSYGDSAVNPARINAYMPKDSTHEQYMEASIKLLDTCDCVYVLKDWYGSAGVMEEIMYAKEHMIPVYFEDIEQTDNVVGRALDYILRNSDDIQSVIAAVDAVREELQQLYKGYKQYAGSGLRPEELRAVDEEYRRLSKKSYEDGLKLNSIRAIIDSVYKVAP